MKANLLAAVAFLFVSAIAAANPSPPPLYLEPVPPDQQYSKTCSFHFSRTMAPPLSEEKVETLVYRANKDGEVLGDFVRIPITESNYLPWNDPYCGNEVSYLYSQGFLGYLPAFVFHDDCVMKGTYIYIANYECDKLSTPNISYECKNYIEVEIAEDATVCSDLHETMAMTEEEFLALKTETGYSEFCLGPEEDFLRLDFSSIFIGEVERKTVVITNHSASSYGKVNFWWEDQVGENIESGEPFLIDTETGDNPCIDEVTELMPGESCDLNIVFAPTAQGFFNRNIVFGCFDIIELRGTGVILEEHDDDALSSDDIPPSTTKSSDAGCSLSTME